MTEPLERLKAALADRYSIHEEIGFGGMATVYLAQDVRHDRMVALKVMKAELAAAIGPRRFLREIKTTAQLTHPHILPLHDSGETDGFLYYVMPYIRGESLRDRLKREKQVRIADALRICREVAGALGYAHAHGVIHRDVKPENILLEEGHAVVADFGIARAMDQASGESLTGTGVAVGTPAYMSPEQAVGDENVDARSDIYSLGCVLYEMLGGDPPFSGSNPQMVLARKLKDPVPGLRVVRDTVPAEVEEAVLKALSVSPSDRFATAEEFIEALEAKEPAPTHRIKRPRGRHQVAAGLGGLLALLMIAWGVTSIRSSANVAFNERDWIVLADLENFTGDPIFDQSLNNALTIAVQQSRYVNVFSASRVRQTMERMGRDSLEALTESVAREVAVRENAAVVVVPSITRIDSVYALAIRMVDPATGDNLASRSVRVTGRAEVLPALDGLGRKLRRDLGESSLAVARHGSRLPQVTTSSLEALKAWAAGEAPGLPMGQKGELWLRAVQLDSNFAMAHSSLGFYYHWHHNDRIKGDEHFDRALSLADRVTERERWLIQASAASWRGDRAGAANTYEVYLAQYPDDASAWYSLGYSLMILDRGTEALAAFGRVLELDSFRAGAHINIATVHNQEGREAEAIPHYVRAFELEPQAFLRGNVNHEFGTAYVKLGELDKAEETFSAMLPRSPEQRAVGLRSLGLLRMYEGRFAEAIPLLRQATALHATLNAPVSEARNRFYLVTALQARGAADDLDGELADAHALLRSTYLSPSWLQYWVRLHARSGRLEQALEVLEKVTDRANTENTEDRLALHRSLGDMALARGDLAEARGHIEAALTLSDNTWSLEPLARYAAEKGDWALASQTYERILERRDLGWEAQMEWVLAHYLLGRMHEEQGDTARAVERYSQFVDIWKNGDEDLAPLEDARKRLRALTGAEGRWEGAGRR